MQQIPPVLVGAQIIEPPARTGGSTAEMGGGAGLAGWARARRWIIASFLAGVSLPTICAGVYLQFVAPTEYLAEARFAIRGSAQSLPGSDRVSGALGQLVALNDTQEAHIVAAYMNSSAIVQKIGHDADLRALFGQKTSDGGRRVSPDAEPEVALAFWNDHVNAEVDAVSGVTTLRVHAFAPTSAISLSRSVLAAGEELANRLTDQVKQNAVDSSASEVARAIQAVGEAQSAELSFRKAQGLLDPSEAAASATRILEKLREDQRRLEMQLRVSGRTAGEKSPAYENFLKQLDSLNGEVNRLEGQLTSMANGAGGALSGSIQTFERLEFARHIADQKFLAANDDLARAKSQAMRGRVYLEAYDPPAMVSSPSRIAILLRVFAGSAVIWGVATLAVAGLRDFGA